MANPENSPVGKTEKGLLVIHSNIFMKDRQYEDLYKGIAQQMQNGLVILPPYCKAIYIPEGIEVKYEKPNLKGEEKDESC